MARAKGKRVTMPDGTVHVAGKAPNGDGSEVTQRFGHLAIVSSLSPDAAGWRVLLNEPL